jgi:hypothetical protein
LPKTWNDGGREVAMATQDKIDWSECALVEVKQGVQSGVPVLRGTRMPVNAIVDTPPPFQCEPMTFAEQVPAQATTLIHRYNLTTSRRPIPCTAI